LKQFLTLSLALIVIAVGFAYSASEVVIYTGLTQWIAKATADEQADKYTKLLDDAGIKNTWFKEDGDGAKIAEWMEKTTKDGGIDVVVLFGDIPPEIFDTGTEVSDGTPAEGFVETTDGNAFINHADYMFWGLGGRNKEAGLQSIMDIEDIVMWDDNTPCEVTAKGKEISPTLAKQDKVESDRPFHVDQIEGSTWKVEASLAENGDGTRADPIIVRDGDKGRVIPCVQINGPEEPLAEIGSEIISWLWKQSTSVEPAAKLSVTWGNLKTQ